MHYDLKEKRGIGIKLYEKIYPHIAKDLRKFLFENIISTKKRVIDLEAETIEDFNDYSVEAQELIDHIQESRENWGK
ncbi:hypothetical protein D3C74_181860 [compost metagenome]